MARNVALFGRRELVAHRQFVDGVTASVPKYVDIDLDGEKEWIVDVYLGPAENPDPVIIRDVPIAPYAKQLVSTIREPVTLQRSRQGKYTIIGRSKNMPAGAQMQNGSIFEPTYHLVTHNFADLKIRHVADIDYTFEELQETPTTELQASPDEPLQVIRGYDAFGYQVLGPEAALEDPSLTIPPERVTRTRHIQIIMSKFGPKGDPDAMIWGTSALQIPIQKVIELVE
jgi:hypothetical protein